MDPSQAEILAVFRDELAESLDQLAALMERLRTGTSEDPRAGVVACFRLAHNIKGAARLAGSEPVERLAHAVEDALTPYRVGRRALPRRLPELVLAASAIMARVADGRDESRAVDELVAALRPKARGRAGGKARGKGPAPTAPPQASGPEAAAPAEGAAAADPAASRSVRVDVGRLDRLMAHVGELLVTHARQGVRHERLRAFERPLRELRETGAGSSAEPLAELAGQLEEILQADRKELQQFGYLTDEIASAVKRLRMLPVAGVVPHWRRIVGDCALELGRQVRLQDEVGDLELDKHVLDGLRDPVNHLLRNAVDHGIESPAERERAGKPRVGVVRVRAILAGSMARLEISDDGRGFDLDRIGEAAVRAGVLDAAQLGRLGSAELLDVLFSAGFSTAREVSRLSGRGVGLDAVRQRVRQLGGSTSVGIDAATGGASFVVSVPISVVSTRSLLVGSGRHVYAVPIEHVERTVRVPSSQVEQVDGSAAVRPAGSEPIRLRWLATVMGEARGVDPDTLTVVVVAQGGARMGIVVSEVLGVEELVTKPLPPNLRSVPGVGGAMILGDGSLAVVLDVGGVLEAMRHGDAETAEQVRTAAQGRSRRVLVVDDSITSRTLEQSILDAAGYDVSVAADGAGAWELLRSQPVDLVVSDIEMPGIDGLELTRRIRADEALKDLPVVLVTSLGSREDVAAGAQAGADEYIVKRRFDQKQLLEAVARHL